MKTGYKSWKQFILISSLIIKTTYTRINCFHVVCFHKFTRINHGYKSWKQFIHENRLQIMVTNNYSLSPYLSCLLKQTFN